MYSMSPHLLLFQNLVYVPPPPVPFLFWAKSYAAEILDKSDNKTQANISRGYPLSLSEIGPHTF
jgi:hypothetical protein